MAEVTEGGYLTLPRRVLRLFLSLSDPPLLSLFLHLLDKARIKAGVFHGVQLARGQYLTGRQVLAITLRLSEKEIRNRLAKLAELELIKVSTTNKFTIVTICNFDSYNGAYQAPLEGANKNGKNGQPEGQVKGQQNFTANNWEMVTYEASEIEKGQQKGQETGQQESAKGPLLEKINTSNTKEYIDISAYLERSRAFYNLGSRGNDVPEVLPSELQDKARKFFEAVISGRKDVCRAYPGGCRGFATEWKEFKRVCPDWMEVVFYLPAAVEQFARVRSNRESMEGFAPAWPSFRRYLEERRFEVQLEKAVERWNEKWKNANREDLCLPPPSFLK